MFTRALSRLTEPFYAFMRIIVGFLFFFQGIQKIFGVLNDSPPPVGSQFWVGGIIEMVGGALILLGLFASYAAFICSGEMFVAYSQFQWKFRFDENFFPHVNHGEHTVLYCLIFFYIACKGAGIFSLDALLAKRRATRT